MRTFAVVVLFLAVPSPPASAQSFDAVGTRAAGMSGAFVAVADDASAVYWNPGGLAAGAYFSLLLDRTEASTSPEGQPSAGSRSAFLLSLSAPALGISYYRLRATSLNPPDLTVPPALGRPVAGPGEIRLQTLVTHHAGATLVQSITDGVAVGASLKLIRGIAASAFVDDRDRDALLGEGAGLLGRATNKFDADVGVMATAGRFRLGLTVRNLVEPEFETANGDRPIVLERQARAGLAVIPVQDWVVAADFDLVRTRGPLGDVRDAAFGAEGRVTRRAFARAGLRFNTLGAEPAGRAPSASIGASYALRGSILVDAQVTAGSERSARGWGVAARFVY
jgi:hypothetical protein